MADQPDLFGSLSRPDEIPGPDVPLAARLRPRSFDDLVGHGKVIGILRGLAAAGRLPSIVLWGPPGSGKTTLAGLLSNAAGARQVSLSAVTSGVADLRRVIAEARLARRDGGRTILFIDELHRFNKAQQDAVLPHVEEGVVTLIGATTENPSFEVIAPLLSRTRIFRLEALDLEDIKKVIARGVRELGAQIDEVALDVLAEGARGDARVALTGLETAFNLTAGAPIAAMQVEEALQAGHLLYDRDGDQHFDIVSALIKSIRGSDADAAVYWLARMLEAGEDVNFVARRLVILAAEDVGLADPQALAVAVAAQQAAHFVGLPEATLPLTEAALYLALAPKSNSVLTTYGRARDAVRRHGNLAVPAHLRNAPTPLARSAGHGQGYRYPHDFPGGWVEQLYLPLALRETQLYKPTERDSRADTLRPDR